MDLDKEYEKQHLKNIQQKEKEIRKLYENSIHEITVSFSQINYNGQIFYLKDYPALLNKINAQIKKLHASIYTATVNGIENSWDLSNQKNNIFVDRRLAGKKPTAKGGQILYDPSIGALDAFIARKEKGLNLSKRVWNTLENYPTELESALGIGISEGRSANEMASDLRKYLIEPDKLFRRVREIRGDPNSKLKLSRRALNYETEPGVYKSSFANAKRLAVTETNISYRRADSERWKTLPFVKGVKVQVSNNHPVYDECNILQGVYPKDFVFTGWHPVCRCFSTAVQISDEEYNKYEDSILEGKESPKIDYIEEIPDRTKEWIKENAERINGWKNKPYWQKDNPDYINQLLK